MQVENARIMTDTLVMLMLLSMQVVMRAMQRAQKAAERTTRMKRHLSDRPMQNDTKEFT